MAWLQKYMDTHSWKTTSLGIIAIIGAVIHVVFQVSQKNLTENDLVASITAIVTGLGLLFARDSDKTSTELGLYKPEEDKK